MKIGEIFEALNEAISTKEYLDEVTSLCEGYDCTLQKCKVDDIAVLLEKLIVMVKQRDI